jgi:hypothetical protein
MSLLCLPQMQAEAYKVDYRNTILNNSLTPSKESFKGFLRKGQIFSIFLIGINTRDRIFR